MRQTRLDKRQARWLSCHAQHLRNRIPRAGFSWEVSEVDLTLSEIYSMKARNLVYLGEEGWRTREKTIAWLDEYLNGSVGVSEREVKRQSKLANYA